MLLQPILRSFLLIAFFVVALAPVHEAKADGGTIMAGILSEKGYDDFSFTGSNNEILFVDLNAAVYQTQGRKGGSHEEVAVVSEPSLPQQNQAAVAVGKTAVLVVSVFRFSTQRAMRSAGPTGRCNPDGCATQASPAPYRQRDPTYFAFFSVAKEKMFVPRQIIISLQKGET